MRRKRVTRVLRALVNKTIDRHHASTLLYGLQLALQSVDRSSWAIGIDTVEGLSQTPDGDVIAFDPDEDLEDDEDEIEEEEEEEVPSDTASNSHHEGAGDSVDENNSEDVDDEEDENESTEQLIATLNQLQSVSRALEVGDMRPLRACLASAADC
jgi:TATA-binding protein-associated factor Taf7